MNIEKNNNWFNPNERKSNKISNEISNLLKEGEKIVTIKELIKNPKNCIWKFIIIIDDINWKKTKRKITNYVIFEEMRIMRITIKNENWEIKNLFLNIWN